MRKSFHTPYLEHPILQEIDTLLGFPFRWTCVCENCLRSFPARRFITPKVLEAYKADLVSGRPLDICNDNLRIRIERERYFQTVLCNKCSHNSGIRHRFKVTGIYPPKK